MQLRVLLRDTIAHLPPGRLLGDLAEPEAVRCLPPAPHSIAEIVAHLDFWQRWFLARCRGLAEPMATSAALGWPSASAGEWMALRARFLAGLDEAVALAGQEQRLAQPLTPPLEFPELAGYTIRDALIHVGTHNAHHLGQVITLRQSLGLWPPSGGGWTW